MGKLRAKNEEIERGLAAAQLDNSYARLPERFYARLDPVPVTDPALIKLNIALAEELGFDAARLQEDAAMIFSGNHVPAAAAPIAMAYAGHQFGNFVPQLGDGRAILLGEVIDVNGRRRDIHLKGSGQTPFSRHADGRAPLGPVVREYIVSEAMQALGIPTTRSLAAVKTGEVVFREKPFPGAVLTRVADSHIRVGTFEYFAARGDQEAVKLLADYVIARLYPAAQDAENPYFALLEAVMERQAALVASWMQVGFIHGVMNTDNMAISGETIDYGPCAFMDSFDPAAVFSSIDTYGRYAWGNQSYIAQWNLARFAETLLPLFNETASKAIEKAEAAIETFSARFEKYWLEGLRRKTGLEAAEEGDKELLSGLFDLMRARAADFTLTFHGLCAAAEEADASALRALLGDSSAVKEWFEGWQNRLGRQERSRAETGAAMRAVNPAYIPRNHQVERAIAAAITQDDFTPMETLLDVLAKPYEVREEYKSYALPPRPDERVYKTFCGT